MFLEPTDLVNLTGRKQSKRQADLDELRYYCSYEPWNVTGHSIRGWYNANKPAFEMSLDRIAATAEPWIISEGTERSGVYFLFNHFRLMYVGKAESIYYRVGQHWAKGVIPFNQFAFVETPTPEMPAWAEDFYIDREQPTCNIKGIRRR